MQRLSILLFILPIIGAAQLAPNSITVTASRNTTPQPDLVRFYVYINAPADASREDVLAAAAGAGLTAADFTGISGYFNSQDQRPVSWEFSKTTPLANLKSTIGLLTAVQNSFAKDEKFSLSFSIAGTEVSPQSCAVSDLIKDARAQAEKLASGAGLTVGSVQALSGAVAGAPLSGSFGIGGVSSVFAPLCSITVKFSLGGL